MVVSSSSVPLSQTPKHTLRKKSIRDMLTYIVLGISAEKRNIMAVQIAIVDYEEIVSGNIEVYQKPINERWNL